MKTFIKIALLLEVATPLYASSFNADDQGFTRMQMSREDLEWIKQTMAEASAIQDFTRSQFTGFPPAQPSKAFRGLNSMQQWGAMQAVDLLNELLETPNSSFPESRVRKKEDQPTKCIPKIEEIADSSSDSSDVEHPKKRKANAEKEGTRVMANPDDLPRSNESVDNRIVTPSLTFTDQRSMDDFLEENLEKYFPTLKLI